MKSTKIWVLSALFLIILSYGAIAFEDSGTATGTFTVGNDPPGAASAWSPTTTHNKSEIFSWTEGTDDNGDPVSTFIWVGTAISTRTVVNTEEANPSYTFTQAESNWDYTWGTESRTYYFNLTSNDGTQNGSYYNSTFTLTDAIPTITDANSTSYLESNPQNIGETVTFNMTSHADTDAADNHSLRVCTQDGIGTDGECTVGEWCKYPSSGYTDEGYLSCTEVLDGVGEPNTIYNASFYVCDCPLFDEACPGQCSIVDQIQFHVNHAPTQGAATMNTSETVYADGVLECVGSGKTDTDSDTTTYYYQFDNGTDTLQGFDTTATFDCGGYGGCYKGVTINCTVRVQDEHGFNDSSNDVYVDKAIVNSPPPTSTGFQIRDGASNWDSTDFDTHDSSPDIQWTEGSDTDGDTITTYVCIANSTENLGGLNCVYETNDADASISGVTGLDYNGAVNTYYIELRSNDGTVNGTPYNETIYINNSIPVIYAGSLSPTETHDQTPTLSWAVSDADDGSDGFWPADSLTNYLRVGTSYGDGTYESSDTANNNTHTVDDTAIPWGTPDSSGWANNTINFSAWVSDTHTGGTSSYYNTTITLYDYLPDITNIVMDDAGDAMSSCISSTCTVTPVEGANATLAIRVTATDTDNDCDGASSGYLTLCRVSDHSNCNPYTNNHYYWQLDKITRSGSTCYYEFATNKTSAEDTPEFFRAGGTYSLYVNVSSQAGARTSDTQRNASWVYSDLLAVSYVSVVTVGGGTPTLGQWNDGTDLHTATNQGNVIMNLTWNTTDFVGPETFEINGSNMYIDDDNSYGSEAGGVLSQVIMDKGEGNVFTYGTGLERCTSVGCDDATVNETIGTYFHIWPPLGLESGIYNSTITLTLGSRT